MSFPATDSGALLDVCGLGASNRYQCVDLEALKMKNLAFKTSEDALATLHLATEAACIGIWDLNVDTGELQWSDLTRKIFGVTSSDSVTLHNFAVLLHPDDRDRVLEAVAAAMEPNGAGEYDIEYRVVRPNQEERFVAAKGKAFFDEVSGQRKTVRFLGTILDRTEQKLAQGALIQAEQLAATGRLAASIAHEINNPLEAVTNLLYLLREEKDEQERLRFLQMAESELARVSEIASNTLRFYRDPKGQSRVGLTALIQSVLGLYQGRIAIRGIELDLACEEDISVIASQGELRQVLVNFVGNALDAMPQGGRLSIRTRSFPQQIGERKPVVGICIADTGTGMSEDVLKRAFEPFYTTKGSSGTGLGLWLSKEILKKHDFKLLVKSKPQHGTVFSIRMPSTDEEPLEVQTSGK